jgi:hypothetical protein
MELDLWLGSDVNDHPMEVRELGGNVQFTTPRGTPVALDSDDVRLPYLSLKYWHDVNAPAPTQAAAEVMALHQSPQARYEDAVAARLCIVPGCPAFPGAAQHFEHGEPCDGTACCEPHPTYVDPEPHDVGHPEPAPCPLVQPLRARPDDRCGDCGGTWRDHRMPFCTDYGTLTLETFPKCPRCGGDWPSDNRHIDDGHCPGRPEGCTCRHDISAHREPHGCMPRDEGCGCKYGKRPTDWSGGVYSR